MKNITHYFSDSSSNSETTSPILNETRVKRTKTDSTIFGLNKQLRMKRKRDKEEEPINKSEQLKPKQIKKLIDSGNNKDCSKQKISEEIKMIENKLEKKKKKNLEICQNEKNNFNTPKRSDSLLTYFSKTNAEEINEKKVTKPNVTVKAEIHKFQSASDSIYTICDKNEKDLCNIEDMSKECQYKLDKIHVMKSKNFKLAPKNEMLASDIRHKPKWSLKIQLQSNLDKPGIIDDSDIYTPIKSLKYQNENIKIPKILLPIKNNKEDSSLDNCISKNKKEEQRNIKINSKEKYKSEKMIISDNERWNDSSFVNNLCKVDDSVLKQQNVQVKCQKNNENYFKNESREKFAPLFTKKTKSCTNIVNNLFVESEIYKNDNCSKIPKIVPLEAVKLPFPKICHITQLPPENHMLNQSYDYLFKKNENLLQKIELLQIKQVLKSDDMMYTPEIVYKCIKSDIEFALNEIKSYCSDVEALWKFVSKLTKSSEQNIKKISKSTDKKFVKRFKQNDLQNQSYDLWTDKYKPNCSNDIVGNEEAVAKLKYWLNSWKSLKSDPDYSSSEEFCTSNSSINLIENNQVAVLIGPHGSGKTASIYAIANELGYKVLEVNASSKRPGKKILKDFEEATKSHSVEKSNLNSIFMSKSKDIEVKDSQNSLILIEDIDLIFEEDDGFISAAFHLASNSKRPIVMTLTNICSHLYKMAPHQLQIKFKPVTGNRFLALLQLIILSETGCTLSHSCLDVLCENGDFRQCLLQLQYLLLSGKEHIPFSSLGISNSFLKNRSSINTNNTKKNKFLNNKNLNNNILANLVDRLDSFTLISHLLNINDRSTYLKFEPSISLIENLKFFSTLDNLSLEIGKYLNNSINKLFENEQIETINYQLSIKKPMCNSVNTTLSQISPFTLNRQSLAIDYNSTIRTICRAEEIRNQVNSKRGNRFFHYLQSFRLVNGTEKANNIFSAACKILQKTPTTITNSNE